jgi:GT2 family glycosyltransferase
MNWTLCIATLNRRDALLVTLRFALMQTRPPAQVVVVDVSDDWQETRALAEEILAAYPDVELDYGTHSVRSLTSQRNAGLAKCKHEIVFLLDDDTFMHATCAEELLRIYEADTDGRVACIAGTPVPDLPSAADEVALPEQKASGARGAGASLKQRIADARPVLWFTRFVLLQSMDELFLKYEEPRDRTIPAGLSGFALYPASFMPGFAMTVRRDVALKEPFEEALRYYAPFEDLDATYRYGRHGAVLQAADAHLHHFEAASGRLKRKKVIIFQMLNMLVFLKRNAARPEDWLWPYRRLLMRRLIGEILKDLLSGRFGFPQVSGVLYAMRNWRTVWDMPTEELERMYPALQKDILDAV